MDNNSTDDSVSMLKNTFSDVAVLVNCSNEGFVKANNRGIRASKGNYVLCLNNDTLVLDHAIDELTRFMDEHPDTGACGAQVLNEDGSVQHQCKRGFPTISSAFFYFLCLHKLFPKSKVFGHYLMTHLNPNTLNEVDSLSGSCMMVRRKVIEDVGIMDEEYVMYGDDLDWCYRVKEAGWKVYYVPQAKIVHYGGKSSRNLSFKCIIWFHRAMALFYKKHYTQKHNLVVNYLVYTAIWIKTAISLLLNLLKKEKIVGSKKP